jgi:hypothetical protein
MGQNKFWLLKRLLDAERYFNFNQSLWQFKAVGLSRNEVNSLKYQIHFSNTERLNSCITENIPHLYKNHRFSLLGKINRCQNRANNTNTLRYKVQNNSMLKRVADIDIAVLQRQIPDSDMTKHMWTQNYKYMLGMICESHINNHNKCGKIKHV